MLTIHRPVFWPGVGTLHHVCVCVECSSHYQQECLRDKCDCCTEQVPFLTDQQRKDREMTIGGQFQVLRSEIDG